MSQVICDKCLAHYDSIALGSIARTGCPLCMAIDRIDLLQQQIEDVAKAGRVENAVRPIVVVQQFTDEADPDRVLATMMDDAKRQTATGTALDALAADRGLQREAIELGGLGGERQETDDELRARLVRHLRERNTSTGSHEAIRKAIGDALPPGWTFDSEPPASMQEPLEVVLKTPADLDHRDLPRILRLVREAIDGSRPVGLGVQIEVVRPTTGGPYRDPIVAMAAAEPDEPVEPRPEPTTDLRTSRALVEAIRFLRYLAATKHLGSPEHVIDIREKCAVHADALEALTR